MAQVGGAGRRSSTPPPRHALRLTPHGAPHPVPGRAGPSRPEAKTRASRGHSHHGHARRGRSLGRRSPSMSTRHCHVTPRDVALTATPGPRRPLGSRRQPAVPASRSRRELEHQGMTRRSHGPAGGRLLPPGHVADPELRRDPRRGPQ